MTRWPFGGGDSPRPDARPPPLYRDRFDAGRALAAVLRERLGDALSGGVVLALPRGGVPVAFEVARALRLPLDVCLVRKLGVPGREEMAMGAIAAGGVRVLDADVIARLGIPRGAVEEATAREGEELERRARAFRGDRPEPPVEGRAVVLVDDGLATGSTMRAAVAALARRRPGRVVVATPVGAREACALLAREAEVVCPATPEPFLAVGHAYEDFSQTTDEEVRDLLAEASQLGVARPGDEAGTT